MSRLRMFCWLRPALPAAARFQPCLLVVLGAVLAIPATAWAQQVNPQLYSGMRWRLIGPFRGGRVTAVAGIPGNPAVYYMGTPGGGVWKTEDGGRVWKPIFDSVPVASIGALALAPSNPSILYVGTGEQTDGNGVYKSNDGGLTWVHLGLAETKFINSVLVDPRNPDAVLVGAWGQPAVESAARGVFRSLDGGKTWTQVLHKDNRTGVADMCLDPGDHQVVFAALMAQPGAGAPPKKPEQDGWIYKSTDGGASWKPLPEKGLPAETRGRIGVAVAPGSGGPQVFAIMRQGLFRSDDGGESWRRITTDPRVVGSSYFSKVFVDPRNPRTVYVMQTSMYRSTDGGETFISFKGAPGGDDYHQMWIDPADSQHMILGVDQGATISLDGGRTWSSWFNQPTGQFYNVVTDNQFPYHVYAEQQDSGTAAVPSRSDYGEITYRDWFSVGGFEFGYIAPDPRHPNIVFTAGWYHTVLRFDKTTGGIHVVFTPGQKYRSGNEAPLVFSPLHPDTLFYATQFVMKTTDGGANWQAISPDLTTAPGAAGEESESPRAAAARVITALAPSSVDAGVLWAGTNQGLIYRTQDGGADWSNATPVGLPAKAHVRILEASHFDSAAAYAAVFAPPDEHPYFYRTRDAGKTWQAIVAGLPEQGIARTVREDPVRRGLLYAGTQDAVYVSFDDGDHWQSLQLNLPTATVRDLAVHGDDLVAATYGRALWILDNVTPLRQAGADVAAAEAHLYQPAKALRIRWDNDQETPLPPEVPAGQNPPDGAMIDYFLRSQPAGEISLEIRDERGQLVRRYTSQPPPAETLPYNVPEYWFAPPAVLSKKAGMNRFVWDLRYPSPRAMAFSYYGGKLDYVEMTMVDNAIAGETPRHQPAGALALPGRYQVSLEIAGKKYSQWLTVEMDPRIPATRADLEAQFALARQLGEWLAATEAGYNGVSALRAAIAGRQKGLPESGTSGAANGLEKDAADSLSRLDKEATQLETGSRAEPGFGALNRDMARLFAMVEAGDLRPSESVRAAAAELCAAQTKAFERWAKLNATDVPAASRLLEKYQSAAIPSAPPLAVPACGRQQ
ncbi:MAG TPA: hypothetical protein VL099_12790 [Candidatus Binatia bacterium]|nr:hypothetical protein [Candidatus Binatia bacterium]